MCLQKRELTFSGPDAHVAAALRNAKMIVQYEDYILNAKVNAGISIHGLMIMVLGDCVMISVLKFATNTAHLE